MEDLRTHVIEAGNCTHCGACAGSIRTRRECGRRRLARCRTRFAPSGPATSRAFWLAHAVVAGRRAVSELFEAFGRTPQDWLIGRHQALFTGHAADPAARRRGASGVISRTLIHLLETELVAGCVVLRQGAGRPRSRGPVLATSLVILAAAQSVYAVTPVLYIPSDLKRVKGIWHWSACPTRSQPSACCRSPAIQSPSASAGCSAPYGTQMLRPGRPPALQPGARQCADHAVAMVVGEWPGYLEVETADGQVLRAEKFYYNYLIPFFVLRNCLITPDFANELTDISVVDAWSPAFEAERAGHSVAVARTSAARHPGGGDARCGTPGYWNRYRGPRSRPWPYDRPEEARNLHPPELAGEGWPADPALRLPAGGDRTGSAAGRMGDLRSVRDWAHRRGTASRWSPCMPLSVVGPTFNWLRKTWKSASRPVKRRGLAEVDFVREPMGERWEEIRTQRNEPCTTV